MKRAIRWATAVVAGAVATGLGATVTATAAPSASYAPTTTSTPAVAAPKPAPGFQVVRTPAAQPLALYAPRIGELWVMERDAAGALVMEHLVNGAWTRTTLAGTVEAGASDLGGSSWFDVWVAAGGVLWHYNGVSWSKVTPPTAADGTVVQATKVADVPGSAVYVGTQNHGVYRYAWGVWTPLGKPAPQGTPRYDGEVLDTYWPLKMQVMDGKLFVSYEWFRQRAVHQLYRYDAGTWTQLADNLGSRGAGASQLPNAWLLRSSSELVVLGSVNARGTNVGSYCATWLAGKEGATCTTTQAVGAAALRSDGRAVVGGADYLDPATGATVQGRFALRAATGAETTVPGDPGDATVAMAAEPWTRTAWAATRTGSTYSIQRWVG